MSASAISGPPRDPPERRQIRRRRVRALPGASNPSVDRVSSRHYISQVNPRVVVMSRAASPETLGFMLSTDPVRAAFPRRSMDALSRISTQASTESLADALAATTDVGTLARILSDADVVGAAVAALEPLA